MNNKKMDGDIFPEDFAPLSRAELSEKILENRLPLIYQEFENAFNFIKDFSKPVSFFGSSRMSEKEDHYQKAVKISRQLSQLGFTIVTGGGPGIMEAANRGAFEANGRSVGLNIKLRAGQSYNQFLTDQMTFYYFFVRKIALTFAAEAFLFFPGGYGTLDEFFELVTLMQTKKIRKTPVILVGKDYWGPLDAFIRNELFKKHNAIEADDLNLYTLTDDESEIVGIVTENSDKKETATSS